MELIERVARAMWEERRRFSAEGAGIALEHFDEMFGDIGAAEANNIYGEARAAIEAMREPTDAQITAFSRACDTNGQCLVKYGYTAMIDAALSRPTPEHKEE